MPALELAYQAIEIEREVLHEAVGCQDQTFAALGGMNLLEFHKTTHIDVHRVPLSRTRLEEFQEHLLVFYTGIQRRAHNIAAKQIENIDKNLERLKRMRRMVDEGHTVLTAKGTLERFGRLLDESWRLKRELADGITNDTIGGIYKDAIEAGAWGGKLLGAGVGGFILFFVPPEKKGEVRSRLARLQEIEVRMNAVGSQIIHADQQGMFSPVPLYDNAGQSGPRETKPVMMEAASARSLTV